MNIYLTTRIESSEKREIIRCFLEKRFEEETRDIKEKLDKSITKSIENHYKKLLGEDWRDLTKKYNICCYNQNLISEIGCLENRFPVNFSMFRYSYWTENTYPVLESRDKFYKLTKHQKSIFYELLDKRTKLFIEFESRGLLNEMALLPFTITWDDLKTTYPDVFEVYIQHLLEGEKVERVKLISKQDDINFIRKHVRV